jgi:3-oxoacyl-[acyl-carrier protein] reductase
MQKQGLQTLEIVEVKKTSKLSGKLALVTGASRGIGKGIAEALAEAGANVVVNYRSREKEAIETCAVIREFGGRALAIAADVSQSSEVNRMLKSIEEEMGPVEILVNNAGGGYRVPLDAIQEEDLDKLIAMNLKSTFLVTQAILPSMRARRSGRIINVSSIAAFTGGAVGPHYAATKAGQLGLTHSYASLLAKEGITVNAIAPALIETDAVIENIKINPEEVIPVGRFGTLEEVGEVAVLLATNGFITGQTININGGLYMS